METLLFENQVLIIDNWMPENQEGLTKIQLACMEAYEKFSLVVGYMNP